MAGVRKWKNQFNLQASRSNILESEVEKIGRKRNGRDRSLHEYSHMSLHHNEGWMGKAS